jgi:1-acyl-sn-glycerol-3-phosphate acyltransferase
VIPVAIAGSYKPFSKMKVIYGNPMLFTHLQDLPKEEQVAVATQEIMDAIHKLLREDLQ